jgi:hypothetical protein
MFKKQLCALFLCAAALMQSGCTILAAGASYYAGKQIQAEISEKGRANRIYFDQKKAEFKASGDPWYEYMEADDLNDIASRSGRDEWPVAYEKVYAMWRIAASKGLRDAKISLAVDELYDYKQTALQEKALAYLKEEFKIDPFYSVPRGGTDCYKNKVRSIAVKIAVYYEGKQNRENSKRYQQEIDYWRNQNYTKTTTYHFPVGNGFCAN